jgi:hypothetical protein
MAAQGNSRTQSATFEPLRSSQPPNSANIMNFEARPGLEPRHADDHPDRSPPKLARTIEPDTRPARVKYLLWLIVAAGVMYGLAIVSLTLLLIVVGLLVGLTALAAWVCIYAQNQSPF